MAAPTSSYSHKAGLLRSKAAAVLRPRQLINQRQFTQRLHVRATSYDRETQRRLPAPPAPPTFVPPPPPMPPPKPPPGKLDGFNISRKGLLSIMVAGGLANVMFQGRDLPPMMQVSNQLTYVKTKGGWPLAVSTDEMGRLYMFDAAGNLFYDTGDKRLGWNMVDSVGNVYNLYIPRSDSQQRVQMKLIGKLDDLVSVPVAEFGGVPIEAIQEQLRSRGNQVVGFQSDLPVEYPPEAPLVPRRTGQIDQETGAEIIALEPAPFLEEGAIKVDKEKGDGPLSWLFGGRGKPPTLLEQMKQLQRGPGW